MISGALETNALVLLWVRREHEWEVRIGAMPGAAIPMLEFGGPDSSR